MAHLFLINSIKKNGIGILPVLFFMVLKSYAQSDFIKDYAFWGVNGVFVQYDKGKTNYGVTDSPVTMYHMQTPSFNLGLSLNVYHHKRFIVKTGFGIRYIYEKQRYHIDYDQTYSPYGNDFIIESSSDDVVMYIPIRLDYLVYKKLFIFTSINPGYYKEYGGKSYDLKDTIEIFQTYPEQDNWLYLDLEFGFGMYLPTKFALFQPYLYYNKSFHNMWQGTIKIKGIKHRPYTEINGTFEQSGNYLGFGLNIYPKKFWKKSKHE